LRASRAVRRLSISSPYLATLFTKQRKYLDQHLMSLAYAVIGDQKAHYQRADKRPDFH
jgi:hypothetical protein